jgi:hypothetical protein
MYVYHILTPNNKCKNQILDFREAIDKFNGGRKYGTSNHWTQFNSTPNNMAPVTKITIKNH